MVYHLILSADSSNPKALKQIEFVQNRKLEKLLSEYLATGNDHDKVILITRITPSVELKTKFCPVD